MLLQCVFLPPLVLSFLAFLGVKKLSKWCVFVNNIAVNGALCKQGWVSSCAGFEHVVLDNVLIFFDRRR